MSTECAEYSGLLSTLCSFYPAEEQGQVAKLITEVTRTQSSSQQSTELPLLQNNDILDVVMQSLSTMRVTEKSATSQDMKLLLGQNFEEIINSTQSSIGRPAMMTESQNRRFEEAVPLNDAPTPRPDLQQPQPIAANRNHPANPPEPNFGYCARQFSPDDAWCVQTGQMHLQNVPNRFDLEAASTSTQQPCSSTPPITRPPQTFQENPYRLFSFHPGKPLHPAEATPILPVQQTNSNRPIYRRRTTSSSTSSSSVSPCPTPTRRRVRQEKKSKPILYKFLLESLLYHPDTQQDMIAWRGVGVEFVLNMEIAAARWAVVKNRLENKAKEPAKYLERTLRCYYQRNRKGENVAHIEKVKRVSHCYTFTEAALQYLGPAIRQNLPQIIADCRNKYTADTVAMFALNL